MASHSGTVPAGKSPSLTIFNPCMLDQSIIGL